MTMDLSQWSKLGLAFAVGVSLSAGYVALGARAAEAPSVVVVEERCPEEPAAEQGEEVRPPQRASELVRNPLYYGMTQTELEAMARDCDVRDDAPAPPNDKHAEALGLSAAEREAYRDAYDRTQAEAREMRLALLHELDPKLDVESLEPIEQTVKLHQLTRDTRRLEASLVHRHLAEERAGLRELPSAEQLAKLGPAARWERFRLDTGNRFAAALSEELGAERVDELRRMYGGWPGGGTRHWECNDVPEAETPEPGFRLDGEGLDKEVIRRVVRAHIQEIQTCYELGLADDAELEGRVAIEFTIDPEGRVSESQAAAESDLDHAGMKECMARAVQRWVFPKPAAGEQVRVAYPFVFTLE
jgi:TonB family protein